jgi:hypothetical protein
VPHIDWQKLYEAAMLEMNPDKLLTCIGRQSRQSLNENRLSILQKQRVAS